MVMLGSSAEGAFGENEMKRAYAKKKANDTSEQATRARRIKAEKEKKRRQKKKEAKKDMHFYG